MVDVVPIFVALTPSLLHHNNVGVTYAGTSNFRMEQVRFVPLYFVVMPKSMITIIEVQFVSILIHIVVGIRSRSQTLRGAKLVNVHEEMPIKVNKVFASRPLNPGGGGLDTLGPLRPPRFLGYFGLLMVNLGRPPLPPNRPYCWSFNYLEYVEDFDPDVHVRVFKAVIRTNVE
jgi:hypothetical protein